mgnify:CR=1 FL=1
MPDEIDLANVLIDIQTARLVDEIRARSNNNTMGSPNCEECDEIIPVGRQKLGFKICVPCAEDKERKKNLYGG